MELDEFILQKFFRYQYCTSKLIRKRPDLNQDECLRILLQQCPEFNENSIFVQFFPTLYESVKRIEETIQMEFESEIHRNKM